MSNTTPSDITYNGNGSINLGVQGFASPIVEEENPSGTSSAGT